MKFKYIGEVNWDSRTADKIRRKHNIRMAEVLEVCGCRRPLFYRVGRKSYAVLGQTEAGRYLLTIWKRVRKELYFLVTARDMQDRERRQYQKWLGR